MMIFSTPAHFNLASSLAYLHFSRTAVVKMVVSHYINSGSKVLACFLDASKAFDRVDHSILYEILLKRGLPPPILGFGSNSLYGASYSIRMMSILLI